MSSATDHDESGVRARILVVDDVPENIDVVAGILRDSYKVMVATNGQRALHIVQSNRPPELVLLDIMMPGMDGLEVCRRLKADEASRDIPVIFLTALGDIEDIVAGLELGAVDYVTKPAIPAVLKARVATHLRLRQAQQALQREMQLVQENSRLRDDVERITRHDLKNPLGIVMGYAAMLAEDSGLDEEQQESARIMEEASYTMLDMINLSLDLYRIEQGVYNLDTGPVDLVKVVGKAISGVRSLAAGRQVDVVLMPPAEPAGVLGEELLCLSLMNNLIRNAVEASPASTEVTIRFDLEDTQVVVCIHNEGAIPAAVRERFFDKYATAGKKQGTGLGTYSARLLTEVQHGLIDFETSEQAGTTLFVKLPRVVL